METTRSSAYRLARYKILPRVVEISRSLGGEGFLLRDIARPIIEDEIPPEFREVMVPYAQREGGEKFIQVVKWFLSLNAKNSDDLEDLGNGMFRLKKPDSIPPTNPSESELESTLEIAVESALDEGDEEAGESNGWIYAYTFPRIKKDGESFPIKIGRTTQDVETRVADQIKGQCWFEKPTVLSKWRVQRVGPTESAVHKTLEARGKRMHDAPGKEWFNTTVQEFDSIVQSIHPEISPATPAPPLR